MATLADQWQNLQGGSCTLVSTLLYASSYGLPVGYSQHFSQKGR
jgi:hypothetical protein